MIDFDKPFICNREYIKAEVRKQSKFTYKDVREEFYALLDIIPVQPHLPTYFGREVDIDLQDCQNLHEELCELGWRMLSDGEAKDFIAFLYPYASMFLAMNDYSDDELSYLYIKGTTYLTKEDEDVCGGPEDALDRFLDGNIDREEVFQMVSYFIVLDYIMEGEEVHNFWFSLESYEKELAEREQEELEQDEEE